MAVLKGHDSFIGIASSDADVKKINLKVNSADARDVPSSAFGMFSDGQLVEAGKKTGQALILDTKDAKHRPKKFKAFRAGDIVTVTVDCRASHHTLRIYTPTVDYSLELPAKKGLIFKTSREWSLYVCLQNGEMTLM